MHISILSFNIHKGVGWQTYKSTIKHIYAEMSILNPDLILLQEVRGFQLDSFPETVWSYISYGQNVFHKKGHYGNAILSKYPMLLTEHIDLTMHRFESRGLLYSKLKLPNNNQVLHLICTHLGLFQKDRKKQMHLIADFIKNKIPYNEKLILAGDFNDWSNDATKIFIDNLGLDEAFLKLHGSYARTYPAWSPFFKLDRVYYRGLNIKYAERLTKKPWKLLSDHIAINTHLELKSHDK